MIRFGIELETINLWPVEVLPHFKAAEIPCVEDKKAGALKTWSVCTDGTFSLREPNCEVVSPITPNMEEVRRVIDILKAAGCSTDGRCGLHIHISDTESPIRIKLPPIKVKTPRIATARKLKNSNTGENYNGIKQCAQNHLEVRVFNGELDFAYVEEAFELVKKSLYHPKPKELPTAFNEWEVITI